MDESRVRELIDAYGADDSRWPDDERDAALTVCAESTLMQEYRLQARALDQSMDAYHIPPSLTVDAILRQIPEHAASESEADWLGRFIDWCLPNDLPQLWRPAIAACLPILVGAYMDSTSGLLADSDEWSESERYLFASYTLSVEIE